MGSKFFPFKEDPFQKGKQNNLDRVVSPKSVYISLKKNVCEYFRLTGTFGVRIFDKDHFGRVHSRVFLNSFGSILDNLLFVH